MTTHAIITPWPLSQGIRTWCALDSQDERVRKDNVTSEPDLIDCPTCLSSMKSALDILTKMFPRAETADTEKVIHVLHEGMPLCGFSSEVPRDWPRGHSWIGIDTMIVGGVDECVACREVAGTARMGSHGNWIVPTDESVEALEARDAELEEFPRIGWCGAVDDDGIFCGNPQFQTLSGGCCCMRGHSGASTLDEDPYIISTSTVTVTEEQMERDRAQGRLNHT